MVKLFKFNILLILFISSCYNGGGKYTPRDHNGPGPSEPPNVVIGNYLNEIERVVNLSEYMEVKQLTTIDVNDFSGKIVSVTFTPIEEIKNRVFIAAGIHGDEIVTTEGVIELLRDLASNPTLYPNTYLEIIPIVNPWGISHGTRENHNGQDLNRDFYYFTQVESQTIRDYIQDKRYDLVLNHHGMWNRGFMMFRFWGATPDTGENVISGIREANLRVRHNPDYGIDNGIVEVPSSDPVHSMDRYMRWNNSDDVYVLETFSYNDEIVINRGIEIQRIAQEIYIRSLY